MSLDLTHGNVGAIPVSIEVDRSSSSAQTIAKVIQEDFNHSKKLVTKANTNADYTILLKEVAKKVCMQIKTAANTQDTRCVETKDHSKRTLGHFFSQQAYKFILGRKSIYTSKLVFVEEKKVKHKPKYFLYLTDYDALQKRLLLESDALIMSPSVSPDGKKIAYVSYEGGTSKVYIQELATAKRELISSKRGLNAAPSWSPDGTELALVLSPHKRAKVFIMNLANKKLHALLDEDAIQTEPIWSPDTKEIIFSSDRDGSVQIYAINLLTKKVRKLTHHGTYNVSPSMSKDGRYLVYLSRIDRKLQTVALELDNQALSWIGGGVLDDNPKIGSGAVVVYSHSKNQKSSLTLTDIEGDFHMNISRKNTSIKYPAWYD